MSTPLLIPEPRVHPVLNGKLFKTPQLALADFDLHLIQDLPHLLL